MYILSQEEVEYIMNHLDLQQGDHKSAWSRRSYAPMLIHSNELNDIKQQIEKQNPDHIIAFDVIFETTGLNTIEFHCDYESIGPFEISNTWEAIRDNHFITIHFNLTDRFLIFNLTPDVIYFC